MDQRMRLITPTLTYDGFDEADMVIEAVFEGMALKKQVFAELDKICKTQRDSGQQHLDAQHRRDRVGHVAAAIGDRHTLLQPGERHAPARDRARQADQQRSDRHLHAALEEARKGRRAGRQLPRLCRQSHVSVHIDAKRSSWSKRARRVEAVDQALYDFGMAMGPLATGDLAGLDVGWRIRKEYRHLEKPGVRQPLAEDRLCEMGRYGQKTGAGWYSYDENRRAIADPEVGALIEQWAVESRHRAARRFQPKRSSSAASTPW